ncbi:MAG: type II secretion system F family protein [Candidatus Woesearchaeota archaeon]
MNFYKRLSKTVPGLGFKLRQAGIPDTPEYYVKKIAFTAMMMAVGLSLVVFLFLQHPAVFIAIFFLAPVFFMYFMKFVDVKIEQIKRKIDEEIVFAGRFLIIELQSGVPIHQCFEDIHRNYKIVGRYFGDIVNKMYMGTSLEDAINDTLRHSPSPTLRRIFWQLINSIKMGSDVAPALKSVLDHIVQEQQIAVKEYGKKLNPLAMFYMMIAVIVPSLGTTMLVVLASFINLNLSLTVLLGIAAFVGFVQFMFLSMIKAQRPPISM